MESRRGRRSNSPTAFSIRERPSTSELPGCRIAPGLVAARIDTYRKHALEEGKMASVYAPEFPRTRFERMQTQADWPAYSKALCNQEHPRTMSLASGSSYNKVGNQIRQYAYAANGLSQASSNAFDSANVTNLLHLWENQKQMQRVPHAPQTGHNVSSNADLDSSGQPFQGHQDVCRMRPAAKAVEVYFRRSYPTNNLQADNDGWQSMASKNTPSFDASIEQAGERKTAGQRNGAADPSHHDPTANGSPRSGNSAPAATQARGDFMCSDASHKTARSIPFQPLRPVHGPRQGSPQSFRGIMERRGHPPVDHVVKGRSVSVARPKTPQFACSKRYQERQAQNQAERWAQKMIPRTSRRPKDHYQNLIPLPALPQSKLDPSVGRTPAPFNPHIVIQQSILSSQNVRYFSTETRQGSGEVWEQEPVIKEPTVQELATSSMLDAGTQTDTVPHNARKTPPGWSDDDSMARHRENHIYHRVSRPGARLERRTRRPAVRRVQVAINLDGAMDLAMDAYVRRSAANGKI
ncbi:MAG: hypothetical protein Q9170_000554 [Blastenia crenularia]